MSSISRSAVYKLRERAEIRSETLDMGLAGFSPSGKGQRRISARYGQDSNGGREVGRHG